MKYLIRIAFIAAALLAYMYRNAHIEKNSSAIVRLSGQADFVPFKLLFISDVHRRALQAEKFTEQVDLVIIGGDFAERGVSIERIRKNLRILKQLAPVYYVFGNNDKEIGEKRLRQLLDEQGVTVLDDEAVELFDNQKLKLVGIDYFAFRQNSVSEAFKNVHQDDSVIFVSHTPFIFKKVAEQYPVSLMLAGHTHGGQIRLGPFGIFEQGGLTTEGQLTTLVSNGFGTTTLPLRLGAAAEFHVLEIRPQNDGKRLVQASQIG